MSVQLLVIGVEKILKVFVEGAISDRVRSKYKCLKEPGGVREVPFGRAGVGHGLDHLVFRRKSGGQPFGGASHRTVTRGQFGLWNGGREYGHGNHNSAIEVRRTLSAVKP
jgi:hypothetical protein